MKARGYDFNIFVEPCNLRLSSYFLGCLFRTMEKYMTAKATSNTPPNIKIKVVTICSPASIMKKSLVGVSAANLLTRRRRAAGSKLR